MEQIAPPTLHVQRLSDGSDDLPTRPEDGKWHCCKCGSGDGIWLVAGEHPLGALACQCPHKPCGSCKTTGHVKPFLPIEEPAIVPVSEVNKEVLFGAICPCCGLSWRAKERGRYKKTLRKMPSLSVAHLHQNRLDPGKGRLRKARSSLVLGDRRIITPPGVGKQAEYAAVRFTGFECTCGQMIDLTALCFQIVAPAVDRNKAVQLEEGEEVKGGTPAKEKQTAWSTTPELEAMGHGKPTINIRGIAHPNPLCSAVISQEHSSAADRLRQENSKR